MGFESLQAHTSIGPEQAPTLALRQATAGTPLAMYFDVRSGDIKSRYGPDRRISAPSEIVVSPRHYQRG
ncbi:MAG: hypothetical protein WB471_05805 [Nocardioides sp.]